MIFLESEFLYENWREIFFLDKSSAPPNYQLIAALGHAACPRRTVHSYLQLQFLHTLLQYFISVYQYVHKTSRAANVVMLKWGRGNSVTVCQVGCPGSSLTRSASAAHWFNKGRAMCHHVYMIMHVKDPQLSAILTAHGR